MAITASLVKELRERTGSGMMECKKALVETDGDIEAAAELMRKSGAAKADKKAGRVAADGAIKLPVSDDAKSAVILEINSETDFVGKDDNFQVFAQQVLAVVAEQKPESVEQLAGMMLASGQTVEESRQALIAKVGENIQLRRFQRIESDAAIASYSHGARIGVLRFAQGSNADIHTRFNEALSALEAAGATLVEIADREERPDDFWDQAGMVLNVEFKATLNAYLASTPATVKTRTLTELIAFNEANAGVELALFNQDIFIESEAMKGLDDPDYVKARDTVVAAMGVDGIDALMSKHEVDVLVSPSGALAPRVDPVNGDVWPDWAGAGSMAAIAGYPHLTVPMGTVHSVPIGLSFFGTKGADSEVLSYGYAYEQATHLRAEPQYLENAEALADIARAMSPYK